MDNRRSLLNERPLFRAGRLSDLGLVALWTVAVLVVSAVPFLADSFLRPVLGLPLLIFIPGYALASALFPRNGDLSSGERVAISVGLSVMVSAFVGLALAVTPIGITAASAGPALAAVSLVSALAGWSRMKRLPSGGRYRPPVPALVGAMRKALDVSAMTALDRRLSAVLAISLVAVVGAAGYVALYPHAPDRYTEFYILGAGGDTSGYPQKATMGDDETVLVGIANHEHRPVGYTVEAYLVQGTPGDTTSGARQRLEGFDVHLDPGGVDERAYRFTPAEPGTQKLVFLLFMDGAPSDDVNGDARIDAAYRELHLWLHVRSA